MKRILFLAALACVLVPAAAAKSSTTSTVSITSAGLAPRNLHVFTGDSVKWTNNDTTPHQLSCAKCKFTSAPLKPGDTYTYTFNTAARYQITDLLSKDKGTVTVTVPAVSATLAAKPHTIRYLGLATLSGTVSNSQSGMKVNILGQACGAGPFSGVTNTTSATGGAFSVTDAPTMTTVYEAKVGGQTSSTTTVKVLPNVRIAKLHGHKFRVSVKAATTFNGKYVLFQKMKAPGRWITVKKVTLTGATKVGDTITTSRTFRVSVRHRRVRAMLTLAQAHPCYAGTRSNIVRS
jgi:plastocyanin